jgi:hypothetical protein
MSAINTNGIKTNYPVPGVNNDSQGFRDNFTSIKNNLDSAGTEISDLQSKVIVKSGLTGATLNNDMANTLISNALVKSFRASTFNLGNNITTSGSDVKLINVSQGDVQYGTITGDTTINFGAWAPSGTQSNVQLILTVANTQATIKFPDTTIDSTGNIVAGMGFSARTLENYSSNVQNPTTSTVYTNTINVPKDAFVVGGGVAKLQYMISTEDCGTTLEIHPINRNQKTNQITFGRTPSSNVGVTGDKAGTMCADANFLYLCVGNYDGSTAIWKKIALAAL